MHNRCSLTLRALLLVATLTGFHSAIRAQMPGHWVRAFSVHGGGNAMSFHDSINGVLLVDGTNLTRSYITRDGGKTWIEQGRTDSMTWMSTGIAHPLTMVTPKDIYYMDPSVSWVSHDSGRSWVQNPQNWNANLSLAGKMFNTQFGICVVKGQSQQLQVFETRDSGVNFQRRSENFVGTEPCNDVLFLDSTHFFALIYYKQILRTSDGGMSWDTVLNPAPVAFFNQAVPSSDWTHLYVLGKLSNGGKGYSGSFFESTDTGATWHADSSIYGARISRMISPAPGKLWALVNHGGHNGQTAADSLFYSSDDGKTWAIDSVTFIGKSLYDILWPDSTHGFVLAQDGDSAVVYRFVNGAASVSPNQSVERVPEFSVSENPLTGQTMLHFALTDAESVRVEVFDVLGVAARTIAHDEAAPRDPSALYSAGEHTVPVSLAGLPSGTYYLRLSLGTGEVRTIKLVKE